VGMDMRLVVLEERSSTLNPRPINLAKNSYELFHMNTLW
jgi:hypothetical protein